MPASATAEATCEPQPGINAMDLKNALGQVEADRGNLHGGWLPFARERLMAFTPWHPDAVSGSHPPHLLPVVTPRSFHSAFISALFEDRMDRIHAWRAGPCRDPYSRSCLGGSSAWCSAIARIRRCRRRRRRV